MINFPFLPVEGLHEFNLDWFLHEFKRLKKNYKVLGTKVHDLELAYEALKNYVDNFFDDLDIGDELEKIFKKWVDSGELEEIITDLLEDVPFTRVADTKLIGQVRGSNPLSNNRFQGSCGALIDNIPYLFCSSINENETSASIHVINLINGTKIYETEWSGLSHANDLAYNYATDELLIAPMGGQKGIYKTNRWGTSAPEFINLGYVVYQLAYNKSKNEIYVITNNDVLHVLNGDDYTEKTTFSISKTYNGEAIYQNADCDGEYLYLPNGRVWWGGWNRLTNMAYQKIDIYNVREFTYKATVYLPVTFEVEGYIYIDEEHTYIMGATQARGVILECNLKDSLKIEKTNESINTPTLTTAYYVNTIYINSNYEGFFCDGSKSRPFNHFHVMSLAIQKTQTNTLNLFIHGDFSADNQFSFVSNLKQLERVNINGMNADFTSAQNVNIFPLRFNGFSRVDCRNINTPSISLENCQGGISFRDTIITSGDSCNIVNSQIVSFINCDSGTDVTCNMTLSTSRVYLDWNSERLHITSNQSFINGGKWKNLTTALYNSSLSPYNTSSFLKNIANSDMDSFNRFILPGLYIGTGSNAASLESMPSEIGSEPLIVLSLGFTQGATKPIYQLFAFVMTRITSKIYYVTFRGDISIATWKRLD